MKKLFVTAALSLCLAHLSGAVAPCNNIIITPGYPQFPEAPGLVECKIAHWHDQNSTDVELQFEVIRVTVVNGRRQETRVGCVIAREFGRDGAIICSYRIEESGTYFCRCVLRTTDTVTGKPNPDVVKVTPDKTVKFK